VTSAVRRFVAIVAASVVCVLLANAVLFFTPLYARVVDPASSTGMLDRAVAQLAAWPADRRRDVLVLGDSRIYGGFNPALADAAGHGLRFLNAGVPGMTPRTWYYLDRAIDPHADRYRAIVIPIDSYGDDTSAIGSLDADDHPSDFRAVVFETTFRDIPKLATSFDGGDRERAMAVDLALRGPLLRYDVQDLLDDPEARVSALRAPPADTFSPQAAHPFTTQLTGLRVDFRAGTIASPAWIGPEEHRELERQILPVPQYSAMYARYRQRWLGPIVARYRATHTPVVFVRIPARPVHRAPPPRPSGTLVAFARDGGVVLLQQGPYVALERPELFADHDHLDVAGARRFSTQLGRDVAAALATFPVATTRAVAGAAAPAAAAAHERRERTGDALGIGAPILVQSYDYVLFLAIVAVLFYALPRRWKPMVLVVASYYFYARWNAWYVVLLAAITVSDFVIGIALERAPVRRRGMLLAIGVGANLAFLGTFKYTNFITANLAAMLGYHGDPWLLELLIPVGISFHTFQSISYLVDVTRRNVKPATNLVDYALYIAFFPQLLSGPIVRAAQFFAELGEWRPPNVDKVERGVREIVLGLVKKLVIVDRVRTDRQRLFLRRRRASGCAGGVERRVRVHDTDLFRLLGLQRHRDRERASTRLRLSGQLRPPVPRSQHRRVLASLAHLALDLAARLSLHPARREPPRAAAHAAQPHADDAARGTLARRQLDVRRLGRVSRCVIVRASSPRREAERIAEGCRTPPRYGVNVRARDDRLGLLPRRKFRGRVPRSARDGCRRTRPRAGARLAADPGRRGTRDRCRPGTRRAMVMASHSGRTAGRRRDGDAARPRALLVAGAHLAVHLLPVLGENAAHRRCAALLRPGDCDSG